MTSNNPFSKPQRVDSVFTIDQLSDNQRLVPPVSLEEIRILDQMSQQNELIEIPERLSPVQRISSWLMSLFFHLFLMILLALIILPSQKSTVLKAIFSETIGDQLDILTLDEGNLNPTPAENYALDIPIDVKIEDMIIYENEPLPYIDDANAPIFDQTRIKVEDMLSGRTDPGTKNDLLAKYGGNKTTQEAVRLGLLWLKKNQFPDGYWSLKGKYSNGRISSFDNPVAATGLAILAFQGDGNSTSFGNHARVVSKAWKWLLAQQRENGSFCNEETPSNDYYYTHSICTMALCELLAMEESRGKSVPKIKEAAKSAIQFLINHQNKELGGWRYKNDTPFDSDLSVTTWGLLALQTAKMAKLEVPEYNWELITKFLDSVQREEGSRYVYHSNELPTPPMTASGLMARMFLGLDRENPAILSGAKYLTQPENLIHFVEQEEQGVHNIYAWYMTSMFLKQLGPTNQYWRKWNSSLIREIPEHQEPSRSREAGSWNPQKDKYGYSGGRLYTTVLSILCLEVYYRHLSLYK
ncbi:MAG: terpene cyclase/mutase family protein [Planctomycetia bacterium]|nr:terpene cyclase/mutase family protein [Planctomycetia bacterium]